MNVKLWQTVLTIIIFKTQNTVTCIISSDVKEYLMGGCPMGGFYKGVKWAQAESVTNGVNQSSLIFNRPEPFSHPSLLATLGRVLERRGSCRVSLVFS